VARVLIAGMSSTIASGLFPRGETHSVMVERLPPAWCLLLQLLQALGKLLWTEHHRAQPSPYSTTVAGPGRCDRRPRSADAVSARAGLAADIGKGVEAPSEAGMLACPQLLHDGYALIAQRPPLSKRRIQHLEFLFHPAHANPQITRPPESTSSVARVLAVTTA